MAYSWTDVVASAGQQNFAFSIPYLSRDHIHVYINGEETTSWAFLMAQVVRLDSGAALNDTVRVRRITPIDEPIVDYNNGSLLGEAQLDASALQSLYTAQESDDNASNTIHANAQLRWDALGRRIINIGTPVENGDAVNKEFADDVLEDAQTSASTASTQAAAAAASAAAAEAALASVTNLSATSTTSTLIGTGSKTFTTQADRPLMDGAWVLITSDADPTNYLHGYVTAYSGTSLTVNVTNVGGSGTYADWTIRVSGTRGATGATGPQGPDGESANLSDSVTSETSFGVSANAGVSTSVSRADHTHGTPSLGGSVTAQTSFGGSSSAGVATTASRSDHTHGTPTNPVTAHVADSDPHTQYQKESEKDAASGYAGLTAGSKINANAVETASIMDAAITKAKIENVAASKLLGRGDSGAGAPQEITLGTGLSMSGTTVSVSSTSESLIHEFW